MCFFRQVLSFLAVTSAVLHAEVPKLDFLFPAGGQMGSTFLVQTGGKVDATTRLWCESPDIHFLPGSKKGEWQVTVTAAARLGPHLVYAWNGDGVSEPRWFSVGRHAESEEQEPNNEADKPQQLPSLPACINGRLLERGDVDHYSLLLKKGETLVAMVEAYALGSPVDMLAHVLNPGGERVLLASDSRNLDPLVVYTATETGVHTLQLAGFVHPPAADIKFNGSAATIYRLHLTTGPWVTHVYPPAVAIKGNTELDLQGYNLDPKKKRVTVQAADVEKRGADWLLHLPEHPLPVQVMLVNQTAQVEKEPNDRPDQATPITPGPVAGLISSREDADRFSLPLKKGQKVRAHLYAGRLGLPLDATLRVEGPEGKEVAVALDQGVEPDPSASWTAATDGTYQIVVEDQFHQGGPDRHYLLVIEAPEPTYAVTLPERKPLHLELGKTLKIKLNVRLLDGFKESLVARVSGLPAGVHAADAPVPAKGGDVEITLQAAANAPETTLPVTFQVWTTGEAPRQITADYPLRSADVRGTSLRDRASWLWLQVR